jgi:hypothetical protein
MDVLVIVHTALFESPTKEQRAHIGRRCQNIQPIVLKIDETHLEEELTESPVRILIERRRRKR